MVAVWPTVAGGTAGSRSAGRSACPAVRGRDDVGELSATATTTDSCSDPDADYYEHHGTSGGVHVNWTMPAHVLRSRFDLRDKRTSLVVAVAFLGAVVIVLIGVHIAVRPTPVTSPTSGASCAAPRNTPGGPDPWGGCWPGPDNTGPSAQANLINADTNIPSNALPKDNTGWSFSSSDGYITVTATKAVIDGVYSAASIYIPAGRSLTVKDSNISYINDEGSSLLVENTTINGRGQWKFATIDGGDNITIRNSNLYNGEHGVLCYGNCIVENSYLHDNANGAAAGAHQNGFVSVNGSNFIVKHNSVGCVGGCTGDISFLDQNANSGATVSKNLLLASPDAAFCAYPGPDNPGQHASNMVWTANVFQKGPHNKCATYGPVYGWYPKDGSGNVWSGNTWDDGTPLNAP